MSQPRDNQEFRKSRSPVLELKITSNYCKVASHQDKGKSLSFICTNHDCLEKKELICEMCLEELHSQHRESWIDISDFLKRVQNKVRILRERVCGSDIQKIDDIINSQKNLWNSIIDDYDKYFFIQMPTHFQLFSTQFKHISYPFVLYDTYCVQNK